MTKFDCLVSFTGLDIEQYVCCNYLLPVCDVINFEINLSLLMKLFFYITKKVRAYIKISQEQKELLT